MNTSLVLGSLVTVSAVAFGFTGSLRLSLTAGITAALCSWATVTIVTARWRRAVAPLGLEPEDVADAVRDQAMSRIGLEERLTLLRAVVNSLPGGLLVLSRHGTLVEHNSALGEVLEARGVLVGLSARELVRDVHLLEAVESASRSLEPISATVVTTRLSARVASLSGVPGSLALITSH